MTHDIEEIAVRIVAYAVDMVLILFLVTVVVDHFAGLNDQLHLLIWVVLLFTYFAVSWVGPLRATPVQFLLGMRVLHQSGTPLSLRAAAIRSAALISLWALALAVFKQTSISDVLIKAALVGLLLYIPSATARRQGPHDFLARSIVINRRAIRSQDNQRRMNQLLANTDPDIRKQSRPSIYKMVVDAVVLAIPLFLMTTAVQVANHKDMRARTAYAMAETQEMQLAVTAWFEETGRWRRFLPSGCRH